ENLWLDAENRPRGFLDAVVGGRSVGVPGLVRMLEQAHARHGSLPWARLFDPAIALAREGFEVSPRLHALLERDPALRDDPPAASLYYDEAGRARAVGERLRNPELADTLEAIARLGSVALHEGPIAREIVARVRSHPRNPGLLDERDLAAYTPILREPVCIDHGEHRICGMPPPSAAAPRRTRACRAAPAPPRAVRPRPRRSRRRGARRPSRGAAPRRPPRLSGVVAPPAGPRSRVGPPTPPRA